MLLVSTHRWMRALCFWHQASCEIGGPLVVLKWTLVFRWQNCVEQNKTRISFFQFSLIVLPGGLRLMIKWEQQEWMSNKANIFYCFLSEFFFYYFPAPVHTWKRTARLHSYAGSGSTQDKPMLYNQKLLLKWVQIRMGQIPALSLFTGFRKHSW